MIQYVHNKLLCIYVHDKIPIIPSMLSHIHNTLSLFSLDIKQKFITIEAL